jgi:hypothetical protein
MFTLFYFVYFLPLVVFIPGFVERVWRLSAISGILIAGVPLEELLFAFTFGMLWASYYEHLTWHRIKSRSGRP